MGRPWCLGHKTRRPDPCAPPQPPPPPPSTLFSPVNIIFSHPPLVLQVSLEGSNLPLAGFPHIIIFMGGWGEEGRWHQRNVESKAGSWLVPASTTQGLSADLDAFSFINQHSFKIFNWIYHPYVINSNILVSASSFIYRCLPMSPLLHSILFNAQSSLWRLNYSWLVSRRMPCSINTTIDSILLSRAPVKLRLVIVINFYWFNQFFKRYWLW